MDCEADRGCLAGCTNSNCSREYVIRAGEKDHYEEMSTTVRQSVRQEV